MTVVESQREEHDPHNLVLLSKQDKWARAQITFSMVKTLLNPISIWAKGNLFLKDLSPFYVIFSFATMTTLIRIRWVLRIEIKAQRFQPSACSRSYNNLIVVSLYWYSCITGQWRKSKWCVLSLIIHNNKQELKDRHTCLWL